MLLLFGRCRWRLQGLQLLELLLDDILALFGGDGHWWIVQVGVKCGACIDDRSIVAIFAVKPRLSRADATRVQINWGQLGIGAAEFAQTGGVFGDDDASIIILFRRVVVFLSPNVIYCGSRHAGPILSELILWYCHFVGDVDWEHVKLSVDRLAVAAIAWTESHIRILFIPWNFYRRWLFLEKLFCNR